VALKLRVLLFEDDPALQRLVSVLIERQGHEVLGYASPADFPVFHGEKCACRQGETCADMLITDHRMPNTTGLVFIRKQKSLGCKVARKTLLMSGSISRKEMEEALSLGCTVFPKPFRSEELTDWIKEAKRSVDPSRKLKEVSLLQR
jgi:CheY-like chemotaxis protein